MHLFEYQVFKEAEFDRVVESGEKSSLKAGAGKEIPLSKGFEGLVREWMLRSGRRTGPMFTLSAELKCRAIQECQRLDLLAKDEIRRWCW